MFPSSESDEAHDTPSIENIVLLTPAKCPARGTGRRKKNADEVLISVGKYKGHSFQYICYTDYGYCGWVLNTPKIQISDNGDGVERFKHYLITKITGVP